MTSVPTILLLEDNPRDVELLQSQLAEANFACELLVTKGRAEFEAAVTRERIDLIVSDYALPDYDGISALHFQQRTVPEIPFIFFSGTLGEDLAVESLKDGAADYVLKAKPGRLISAIQRALAEVEARAAQQRAQEALRRSEARHRSFIAATSLIAWVTNARGLLGEDSPTWRACTGQSYEEIKGLGWADALHPEDRATMLTAWMLSVARQRLFEAEARLRRSDGEYRYFLFRGAPVMTRDAAVEEWMGTAIDITESKRIRQALQDSEERFRMAVEVAQIALAEVNYSSDTLHLSPEAAEIFGLPISQPVVPRQTVHDLLHPGDRAELKERIVRSLDPTGPEVVAMEIRIIRADGNLAWVSIRKKVFFDRAAIVPTPLRALVILLDITIRKQAEESLRKSEERFRQFAENIQEVFWMTDLTKEQMLYISPAYEKIWGATCESLYASPTQWTEAIHPDDRTRVCAAAKTKQISGEYDEIYRVTRPDGSLRWIHDRAFPIRNSAGIVYRIVGTAEDITERHNLETELRQAQKMEAIGTLAGGIAHDFNNILGSINGFVDLAKLDAAGNTEVVDSLDEISKAGWRAAALVRQILAFSRRQDLQRQPLDLRSVVEDAFKLLRATIPSTIQFHFTISAPMPLVLADATQMHQILMNLGANAAHAMRAAPGRLDVSLEDTHLDAEMAIAHPELKPGRFVRLSIGDTGHGMSRTVLDRIFEPFFTTKAPGEGTGLGLAVVHGIIKAHEGAISVRSTPGTGTVFDLWFPAIVDRRADTTLLETDLPRGQGQRILYVDDEEPLCKLGIRILARLGYFPDAQKNSLAALELVKNQPDTYALVITDLAMPEMDGIGLATKLHELRGDLPILLTTGNTENMSTSHLHEVGIREIIAKPFSQDSLAKAVARLLGTGKPI